MSGRPAKFVTVRDAGAAFTVEAGEIGEPGPGELLVDIVGVGICHTDLAVRGQAVPFPLPAVLGHEGAGIVRALGTDVVGFQTGDAVVLSFASCGDCVNCRAGQPAYCSSFFGCNFSGDTATKGRLCDGHGAKLTGGFFGQSSFASRALVSARCAVKAPQDVPLELLGPLGCGVQTGAGAVLNSLKVRKGSSIAIFGAGSVGLSALLAARVAECRAIVVVDPMAARREMAMDLGAASALDPKEVDPVAVIRRQFDGGVDYALECTGVPTVLRQAFDALSVRGVCGAMGVAPFGAEVAFDVGSIVAGRSLVGIVEGDSLPQEFIPQLIELWRAGRFPFDRLIKTYPMEKINTAVDDMHHGRVIKPVLIPSPESPSA